MGPNEETTMTIQKQYDSGQRDFQGADLQWANLQGANLRRANLRWANLEGADLKHTGITIIQGLEWPVIKYPTDLQIGCKRHTYEDWAKFTDDEISSMDENALTFWRKYREFLLTN